MYISQKYLINDGQTPENGSLGLQCKCCKRMFAIPPSDITAELANATYCDDPACVAAAEQAANQAAAAELKSNVDLEHTGTLK